MHIAARENRYNAAAPMRALLDAGAELNARDADGEVPLHEAARYNEVDAVMTLLDAGADPNAPNEAGETPLHAVALRQPMGIFCELEKELGESSLRLDEYELKEGAMSVEILRALVDAGAHSSARDRSGRTALHQAAEFSPFPSIIEALLDAGADAKSKDHEGRTPYDVAVSNPQLKGSNAFWRLNDSRY